MKIIKETIAKLVATGFFHVFGSNVINKFVAFLSNVVLLRILSKSEYGVFTYAWNLYGIIVLLNGAGLAYGILQLCSERSSDKQYCRQICETGIRYGEIVNLGLAGLILLIAIFVPLNIPASNALFQMTCLLPMVQFLFDVIISYLRSQKRNQDYSMVSVLNTIFVFVFSVIASILFREKGLIIGYYMAYTISVLIFVFHFHVRMRSNEKGKLIGKRDKRVLWNVSLISMCNNGISEMLYLLDVFILGLVDSDETILASYKAATMIPTALAFIPLAFAAYVYPYFAEHQNDKAWCLLRYKQLLLGAGALNALISGALILFAPFIIKLVFGAQYLDAVPVFRLLSFGYFFSGTFRVLAGNLLVSQRRLTFNLFVAVISALINIVADYFFITWWGAIGAAIVTILVFIISGAMSTSYLFYILTKKNNH